MTAQIARFPTLLTAHLQLSLIALLIGIVLSLPLGILATRILWLEKSVLAVASIIHTIPGLALLAVMVPLLATLHLPDIGFLPAITALSLYSLLPILRNTVTGISNVNSAYIDASRGVGMTPIQQLIKVELPLALPFIVAGVRTATVWVVGIATLSTAVGAPSLGNYIFQGLHTRNFSSVLIGCLGAALLALLLDGLVHTLEWSIQNRKRTWIGFTLSFLSLLYLFTGFSLISKDNIENQEITIGTKAFTEQYILGEILSKHIIRETGKDTKLMKALGSTIAFDALRSGTIDLYVDYSGTIWATIMQRKEVPRNPQDVLSQVKDFLQDQHGILLIGALGFKNAYTLAMRREQAESLGINNISDLASFSPRMSIGGDYEFFGRPEWKHISQKYNLIFDAQHTMDPSLMYQSIAQGSTDIIGAYTTDGRIQAFDLQPLKDNLNAIPPYDAIILANVQLAQRAPKVIQALFRLVNTIDAEKMRRMNQAVDQYGRLPAQVAIEFLNKIKLIQESGKK